MAQRDYYEVLGISKTASQDEIKAAYRRLARKFHPDVNKAKDAVEKFKEATAAYDVLSDPNKRKMYDQFGFAGPGGFGGAGGPGAGRPGGGAQTWAYGPGGQGQGGFEDMFSNSPFSGMSLEELLGSLGGYSRRSTRRGRGEPAPAPEMAPAQTEVTLDFLQAVKGTTMPLQLTLPTGQAERIDVKIPPGVRDGSRIRVRGKSGSFGDLFIVTRVREHPYFRREDHDIYLDVPVSLREAALGGEVTLPTIDGSATLRIPAGSSSGMKLRMRGRGAMDPKTLTRGDQYVVLKIVLPKTISDEGKKLIEQLDKTDPCDPRKTVNW